MEEKQIMEEKTGDNGKLDVEKNRKHKGGIVLVIILALVTAVSLGISVWAIWFRKNTTTVLNPDYAPQEVEPNIEPIDSNDSSKLDVPEGGGGISLIYTREAIIDLNEKKAALQFGNPSKSTQDIVLQIIIQGEVVIQSRRIPRGNQVTSLDLLEGAEKKLKAGEYDGKYVILSYDPNTGEKAMVNTEIPITVKVKD